MAAEVEESCHRYSGAEQDEGRRLRDNGVVDVDLYREWESCLSVPFDIAIPVIAWGIYGADDFAIQ